MDSKTEEILNARTIRLARPSGGEPVDAASALTMVIARADQTGFAVDAEWVIAAVTVKHVARLPGLPATTAGILDFRGTPLVAFHPSVVLHQQRQAPAERTLALVLGYQQPEVAMLMDDIEPPREVRSDEIHPPPLDLPERAREFLRGVTRTGELVIAVEALLASGRLYAGSLIGRGK